MDLFRNRSQRTSIHSTKATATAVAQVCSPRAIRETSVCGTVLQYNPPTKAYHPSWVHGMEFSSIIMPFSADSTSSSSTASTVATRVHSLHYKASLHATSNPILCEANQAHYPNLIQPRTVDCLHIYPSSIPTYFLQWQLLLPTPLPAFPLEPLPLLPRSAFEASFYAVACSMPSH